MINWQRVAELKDEVGEDDFAEVAELFLEEVEDGLASLDPEAGPDDVGASLHNLKGSALNLGFAEFAALCATFEGDEKTHMFGAPQKSELVTCFTASKESFLDESGSNTA